MMRLLKVYLLISMGKCISWLEREKSRGHTATPFIAQMVGKTCTFQVRASSYNFAANHQTFTISRILNERDRLPLSEMAKMIMAMICLGISQCLLRWTLMVTTVRKHQL